MRQTLDARWPTRPPHLPRQTPPTQTYVPPHHALVHNRAARRARNAGAPPAHAALRRRRGVHHQRHGDGARRATHNTINDAAAATLAAVGVPTGGAHRLEVGQGRWDERRRVHGADRRARGGVSAAPGGGVGRRRWGGGGGGGWGGTGVTARSRKHHPSASPHRGADRQGTRVAVAATPAREKGHRGGGHRADARPAEGRRSRAGAADRTAAGQPTTNAVIVGAAGRRAAGPLHAGVAMKATDTGAQATAGYAPTRPQTSPHATADHRQHQGARRTLPRRPRRRVTPAAAARHPRGRGSGSRGTYDQRGRGEGRHRHHCACRWLGAGSRRAANVGRWPAAHRWRRGGWDGGGSEIDSQSRCAEGAP